MTDTLGRNQRTPVDFAPYLIPPRAKIAREERIRRSREMLFRVLSQNTTVAFVGSGCSVPLGYPNWTGFVQRLVSATREYLEQNRGSADSLKRCTQLLDRLSAEIPPGAEEMMFAVSICREILKKPSGEKAYQKCLEESLSPRGKKATDQPLHALLDLPIHRFVTTNYDHEIEHALATIRQVPLEEFGLLNPAQKDPRSFTQKSENCDRLALFALARPEETRDVVFHCHGRCDDFESIIATESDYQNWYLANGDEEKRVFQQTLDVLLGANPILFVGYSLSDEGLLRPLRLFHATCPEERFERPFFALMPEKSCAKEQDQHDYLFERYGLNVLPFAAETSEEIGPSLCGELRNLRRELTAWRQSWSEKPCFRKVNFLTRPPQPYRHPGPIPDIGEPSIASREAAELLGGNADSVDIMKLLGNNRIVVLLGKEGTGKSWRALQLIESLSKAHLPPFQGFFFWSSYYSDDLLSGVERLLHYLDPEARTASEGSRLGRLERLLHAGEGGKQAARYLIVFDGFDRLLHRSGRPDEGRIENPAARKFIELFLAPECESRLLLTSQLWPLELERCPDAAPFPIGRLRFFGGKSNPEFFCTGEDDTAVLYALLDGHAYALLLAERFLARERECHVTEPVQRLAEKLFGIVPERRIWGLIEEIVQDLDRHTNGFARPLLERLAVFMTPVTSSICALCYREVKKAHPHKPGPGLKKVLDQLVKSSLLAKDSCGPSDCMRLTPIWTVQPTVRKYVFEQVHGVARDALPHFALSGFTSGDAAVHPGSAEAAEIVKSLWERLYGATKKAIDRNNPVKARELCRALFGVMRARMEAITTPRWWTYKEYARYCVRLIDLVRRVSYLGLGSAEPPGVSDRTDPFWTYCEPQAITQIEWERAPLHSDELAWLYNELGLTLLACGHMVDCLRVWEQGYEINRVVDGTTPVPSFTLESQLHLVHTFLDLGRLPDMRRYLDEAERTNAKVEDPDASGRILGFRALLAHLQSDFDEADRLYTKAIKRLRASQNARGESYFLSHRAALEVSLHRFDRAEDAARSCRALAETADYPDLVVYSRLAAGQVCRAQGKLVDATVVLNAALREAKRLQLGRLQAEILTELARLALDLGDSALARQRALEALEISNGRGLGLRRSHSLLVLGLATLKAEQRKLGIAYLKQAQKSAEAQEYWLCRREALERLEALGAALS